MVLWIGVAGAGVDGVALCGDALVGRATAAHDRFYYQLFLYCTASSGMFFPVIGQLFEGSGPLVAMYTILVADIGPSF